MSQFFDLHFHPLGKHFLGEFNPVKRETAAYRRAVRIPWLGRQTDRLIGKILNSQACVDQCLESGVSLGVATVVAPELVFASRKGLLCLLEFDLFKKDVIAPLDNEIFEFIRKERNYNYLFEQECKFYLWANRYTKNDRPEPAIHLLNRKSGQLKLEKDKLNLVLAIEGGHNLYRNVGIMNILASPVDVVQMYKKNDEEGKRWDFLYLTLTHLSHISEQPLCNHAFGFKLVKGLAEAFPQVNGLLPLGKEVINASMTGDHPILIDVKHMSLKARQDFYEHRREQLRADNSRQHSPKGLGKGNGTEKRYPKGWPILATHVGVTGYPVRDMIEYIDDVSIDREVRQCVRLKMKRVKAGKIPEGLGFDNVHFNPTTINLCDDDIEEITKSDGLIGISLDARILGYEWAKKRIFNNTYDYIQLNEFQYLFPALCDNLSLSPTVLDDEPLEEVIELNEKFPGFADRKKREAYLFCFNVLHVVAVINSMPAEDRHHKSGWDFLCIGSDYDGLIDSIKMANTAHSLPAFKDHVRKIFHKAEKAYKEQFDYDGQLSLLPDTRQDLDSYLDKLFYGNGSGFLKRWWGIK